MGQGGGRIMSSPLLPWCLGAQSQPSSGVVLRSGPFGPPPSTQFHRPGEGEVSLPPHQRPHLAALQTGRLLLPTLAAGRGLCVRLWLWVRPRPALQAAQEPSLFWRR